MANTPFFLFQPPSRVFFYATPYNMVIRVYDVFPTAQSSLITIYTTDTIRLTRLLSQGHAVVSNRSAFCTLHPPLLVANRYKPHIVQLDVPADTKKSGHCVHTSDTSCLSFNTTLRIRRLKPHHPRQFPHSTSRHN